MCDSITLDFDFYPERWTLKGDTLWVVNTRDSLFLHGVDIASGQVICNWGQLGNGPDDFILPGLIEGESLDAVRIYSNSENRVSGYALSSDGPSRLWLGHLPLWKSERGLPKPYTRIASLNDSVAVATYFFPRKAGADVINFKSGKLIGEVEPCVSQPEGSASGPFEFKLSTTSDKVVAAYRYIDCLGVYEFNPDNRSLTLLYTIGDKANQCELYEADKDDEMIRYYSDVQLGPHHAYLLYQGIPEGKLAEGSSRLLIYDVATGSNVKNIQLDKYYDQLLIGNDGKIVLHSPLNDDAIFIISNPL